MEQMNPFEWAAKVASAHERLGTMNIKNGQQVEVCWDVDRAYGGGTRSHRGIFNLDGNMICVEGSHRTPGYLRIAVTGLRHIELVNVEEPINPFLAAQ